MHVCNASKCPCEQPSHLLNAPLFFFFLTILGCIAKWHHKTDLLPSLFHSAAPKVSKKAHKDTQSFGRSKPTTYIWKLCFLVYCIGRCSVFDCFPLASDSFTVETLAHLLVDFCFRAVPEKQQDQPHQYHHDGRSIPRHGTDSSSLPTNTH